MKIKAGELLNFCTTPNGLDYYLKDDILIKVKLTDYFKVINFIEVIGNYVIEITYSNENSIIHTIILNTDAEIEIRVFSDITNVIEMSREN